VSALTARMQLNIPIVPSTKCRTKRKGDLPCERPPFLSDFLKLWFGFQITTLLSRSYSILTNLRPRFPHSSVTHFVVRAFSLPPFTFQLPGLLLEFRCRFPRWLLVYSLLLEDLSSDELIVLRKEQISRDIFVWKCCIYSGKYWGLLRRIKQPKFRAIFTRFRWVRNAI
jgi:hypothetical protein